MCLFEFTALPGELSVLLYVEGRFPKPPDNFRRRFWTLKKFLLLSDPSCVVRCNCIQNDARYGIEKKRDVGIAISNKCPPVFAFQNNKRVSETVSPAMKAFYVTRKMKPQSSESEFYGAKARKWGNGITQGSISDGKPASIKDTAMRTIICCSACIIYYSCQKSSLWRCDVKSGSLDLETFFLQLNKYTILRMKIVHMFVIHKSGSPTDLRAVSVSRKDPSRTTRVRNEDGVSLGPLSDADRTYHLVRQQLLRKMLLR